MLHHLKNLKKFIDIGFPNGKIVSQEITRQWKQRNERANSPTRSLQFFKASLFIFFFTFSDFIFWLFLIAAFFFVFFSKLIMGTPAPTDKSITLAEEEYIRLAEEAARDVLKLYEDKQNWTLTGSGDDKCAVSFLNFYRR